MTFSELINDYHFNQFLNVFPFYSVIPEAIDGGFNRSEFYRIIRERAVDYFGQRLPDDKTREDLFQAVKFQFTPWPHSNDTDENDQNRQAFNDVRPELIMQFID